MEKKLDFITLLIATLIFLVGITIGFYLNTSQTKTNESQSVNNSNNITSSEEDVYYLFKDINNDNKKDKISISFIESNHCIININNALLELYGNSLLNQFSVVDINKNDNYKEILIFENGASMDPSTTFLCYDGKDIYNMGNISGFFNTYDFNGNGVFYAPIIGKLFYMNLYCEHYVSNKRIKIKPKEFYEVEKKVIIKYPLTLVQSKNSDETVCKLDIGEEATIIGTDNINWGLFKTEDGKEGWLHIQDNGKVEGTDKYIYEVFDGFIFAD
jgi:hypothetical protein